MWLRCVTASCRASILMAAGVGMYVLMPVPALAASSTITFENLLGQQFYDFFNPVAQSGGFDFTSRDFHFHIGDSLPGAPGPTSVLLQDVNTNIITMTHSGASPFNLLSVDIGATPGLTITGHKNGGGTVSTITAATFGFTTEVLTNFTNLLSVDFQATQGIANNNTFWLDNLNVSTVLTGDLNGDGFVGIADLNIVLGAWNQNVPPGNPLADPSGDGFVGIADLNVVLGNWNAGTPPNTTASVPEPGTAGMVSVCAWTLSFHRTKSRRPA